MELLNPKLAVVATPDHLHRSKRLACGCVLLKKQRTKKKVILTPRKVYPYMSVKKSLENLLNRPGFVDKCELWRLRRMNQSSVQEYFGDVYDGNVWTQEFNSFLSTPHSYLLNMNVDWFKPFVRGTTYSLLVPYT